MNKKILAIVVGLIVLFGICICVLLFQRKNRDNEMQNTTDYLDLEIDKNQIAYNENATIDEIKEDTGISGNNEIYELQTEFDGRRALVVKANIKYKVAFAGMIKNDLPQMNELDTILEENFPKNNGVWVNAGSRDKLLKLINNSTKLNSKYSINDDGYIIITEKNNQTDLDKKFESAINNNQSSNILSVSSVCYTIDDVTGKIIDNDFEFMDKYQTYDYFEDENKKIIFITENKEEQLPIDEIIESVINLL